MIILTFNEALPNNSLAVGDLIYYVTNINTNYDGSQMWTGDTGIGVSTHIFLGEVASIKNYKIEDSENVPSTKPPYNFKIFVKEVQAVSAPTSDDFIFFVKNNTVEQSAIKGYHNTVTLQNDSTKKAELFAVSCDVTESSK